jgi:hypothetical protein
VKIHPATVNTNRTSLTRREFIGAVGILGAGAALGGLPGKALAAMAPPPPDATPTVPVLTIGDPTQFKILQVTDIHLFAYNIWLKRDRIDAVAAMVRHFKPDIIVNTGDFWISKSGKGWTDTCQRACREFAKLKTPWAFAWGNHDETADTNRVHACLERSPYLLYSGAADGNYRVEVRAKDSKTPLWNLILLNDSRGGFKPEQIDWFKAESQRIKKATSAPPAFLFFHIPLPQYDDLITAGKAVGVKLESVCHENGSREALGAFRDAGFVKATFCGHDHTNDYSGVVDGMRLQYGRATGGYGAEKVRKGGTLITIDIPRKTFDVKTVFPDGSSATFDKLAT